jgi:hypothetical protein
MGKEQQRAGAWVSVMSVRRSRRAASLASWRRVGRRWRGAVVRWSGLSLQVELGRSPRTVDAYACAIGLSGFCERAGLEPIGVSRARIAGYVRGLRERPDWRGQNLLAIDSGGGLWNATLGLRLAAVRLPCSKEPPRHSRARRHE